jgi:TetR/AcrR family transcriptional regulator
MVDSTQKTKRNPPDEARPADVRERILAEAVRLFGMNGYEATSLQSIAEAVGIRKPSLLYHFPSKEALHQEVIDTSLGHWREELPRVLAESATGYDRFTSAMKALLAFFRSEPNRARLTVREMLDRPEALRERLREHLSPWIRVLTDYLRMAQGSGIVKPGLDPESYVVQVLMMVVSTAAIGQVAGAITDIEEKERDSRYTQEMVRIAREALYVVPPSETDKA